MIILCVFIHNNTLCNFQTAKQPVGETRPAVLRYLILSVCNPLLESDKVKDIDVTVTVYVEIYVSGFNCLT